MLPPFPCPGTIPAPSCPVCCQPGCSPAPSFGSIVAASFHLCSRSTKAPTLFCTVDPAPSPSELGQGTRLSPSTASRPAQLQTPSLAARVTVADRRACAQEVLLLQRRLRRSWNRFPTLPARTATEVRPLTTSPSSRGQGSGGALWRPVYTPG
jgi:hypothetical protein